MTSRTVLKGFFKRGAVPTESNFADLIDSMLNQDDDSIAKPSNDPLKIIANGAEETLINFYEQGSQQPSWQITQKPGGKAGLSMGDGSTATPTNRFFIETGTGNVGIGTTTPANKLHVNGNSGNFALTLTNSANTLGKRGYRIAFDNDRLTFQRADDDGGFVANQIAITPDTGNVGIGTISPESALHVNLSSSSAPIHALTIDVNSFGTADNARASYFLQVRDIQAAPPGGKIHFLIRGDGRVGIGTANPQATLDVNGSIKSTMWKVTQVFNSIGGPLPLSSGEMKDNVVLGGGKTGGTTIDPGGLHTLGSSFGQHWEGGFTSQGGTIVIFASGSAFRDGSGGMIGMQILIDEVSKGNAGGFVNDPAHHQAFVANALVLTGIAAGNHKVTLARLLDSAIVTNGDDRFSLTVFELPF